MCLGLPGQIKSITGEDPLFKSAQVAFGGVQRQISLMYTPDAQCGDYVLVHAGFALSVIDQDRASTLLSALESETSENKAT
ncbi:MAG: HypC/HybG/HupF family hydrogenase formation chaperone [Nitrosomonas sp.]|nr:HypC/HybG/HupF family hydrogenase formation chaperone [Nitrosomonas sp.]